MISPVAAHRRSSSKAFLGAYRAFVRLRSKTFSVLMSGAYASFGSHSVIEPPLRVSGESRIAIGSNVFVGAGCWLQVLDGVDSDVAISIGDGTNIAGGCVLSAALSITLGRRVLIARNVYVADHVHAFQDPRRAVLDQGVNRVAPVTIADGAWLGENVVVGPGVRIGTGAVVGANAVVLEDVPDHAVAVGAPARVVRRIGAPSPAA
jgi:acetyltransferase-like isoleucine patch superfamily enzyme